MVTRPNNPIGFSRLVSVKARWLPFTSATDPGVLTASLNFSHEIIGADKESPVKFRLELTAAELLVKCPADTKVVDHTVLQPTLRESEINRRHTDESSLGLGTTGGTLAGRVSNETEQTTAHKSPFVATTQDDENNPIFEFSAEGTGSLRGPVWDETKTLVRLKSLKAPKPYDPCPMLNLRAYSDDFKIIKPVIRDKKSRIGWNKCGKKRAVALQYLKKCIVEDFSLDVDGNLEDSHSLATLLMHEPATNSDD